MAGSNIHMKITGPPIAGESTDAGHAGELELSSVQHGISRAVGPRTTAGSPSVGNSNHSEIVATKLIDKSTPEIAKSICQGLAHSEVKITVDKTENNVVTPYLVYTLTGVIFTSSSLSAHESGGLASESLSMNYATIKWEYTPTDPATHAAQGVVPFGWDVSQNKVV